MDSSTGVTVLLVEDDPADARVVEQLLVEHQEALGGEVEIDAVEHASQLSDGLELAETSSPDIVLLDLGLPDSEGLATIDAMVERVPTVPILVLTGRSGDGVDAIRRGAQDYLVKQTITGELLARTIRYAIERARVTRELRDRNHRLALANEIVRTELRNDVSMVVGLADQLAAGADPEDEPIVDSLLTASQHALELADTAAELMDVLSGETIAEASQPIDVRTILEPELDALRADHDVDLTVDWHDSGDGQLLVSATPMLGSAFAQLLTNAATHTDRETAQIELSVDSTPDRVSVTIADDGIGIADARKAAILDPDADPAGIGVGLYFVRTVLESAGGELDIADNQPRGTVVTVTLDRVD